MTFRDPLLGAFSRDDTVFGMFSSMKISLSRRPSLTLTHSPACLTLSFYFRREVHGSEHRASTRRLAVTFAVRPNSSEIPRTAIRKERTHVRTHSTHGTRDTNRSATIRARHRNVQDASVPCPKTSRRVTDGTGRLRSRVISFVP